MVAKCSALCVYLPLAQPTRQERFPLRILKKTSPRMESLGTTLQHGIHPQLNSAEGRETPNEQV